MNISFLSLRRAIIGAFFIFQGLFSAHATNRSDDENWRKADSSYDYPPPFSEKFIDSITSKKNAVVAKNLRTLDAQPFMLGEKLVFQVGWGPLSAGFAFVTADPDTTLGTTVISARGATNGFFSGFYKVRDRINTTVDTKGIYPFFFEQHIHEGRYQAKRWEFFDQARNFVFSHKKSVDSTAIKPFTQNFLSLIYFLRSQKLTPGDSVSINCFVDSKCYDVIVHCVERNKVTVDAGTFDCLLLKPILVGKGRVFSKKDEIKLWVTDDACKMPVKVESKIAWGSIFAKLVWYSRKG
jgi:hypothetical protein